MTCLVHIDKPCLVWYHVFMNTFEELRDDLYVRIDESCLSSRDWINHTDSFKELCERYTEFYEQILDEVLEQKHLDLWASVVLGCKKDADLLEFFNGPN